MNNSVSLTYDKCHEALCHSLILGGEKEFSRRMYSSQKVHSVRVSRHPLCARCQVLVSKDEESLPQGCPQAQLAVGHTGVRARTNTDVMLGETVEARCEFHPGTRKNAVSCWLFT